MRIFIWDIISKVYPFILRTFFGMDVALSSRLSYKAKLDTSVNPKGIHIGAYTWVLANATILAHDSCRGLMTDTYIGERCVIGINSIVMPGCRIGDSSIVAAGAVVTKDVPPNCIAAGNPAKVIKEGIIIGTDGLLVG